ncbi:ACT domain-containing protein [Candidatus Berkiella aquae]|uniref:Glycine cleavage system transcriptional repressor n=1 Tax=Candidatus Berkiella aquae TaxID=295108 RepID=A0A0Q9YNH6_9GAMM|nr:ACT domain-containing protein [Candidatus Berkiella aquae]MCS5712467.1 hypothetical protein [Candidatus Berkiella aquae]
MSMNNQHYLVITALGSDRLGILETFTKLSKQCGGNILESKLSTMGEECAILFHLSGTWNAIAKLEAALPSLAELHRFAIHCKRTLPKNAANALPYQVQVFAKDRPGILNELATFFSRQGILVDKMETETYLAKNNTTMSNIILAINIPAKLHIATIRERFMEYCEDRNLDAMLEPSK